MTSTPSSSSSSSSSSAPKPPPPSGRKTRLRLEGVPRRRWWARLLMVGAFLSLVGITSGVLGVVGLYYKYAPGLPDIPKVDEYWPPILTEVHTADAVLAGEFYSERRKVVPYERMPKRLVQAFIASEDSSFFDHDGVDVLGTVRAAFKTAMKKLTKKGSVQGGSTLTQQTAKAVLANAELTRIDAEQVLAEAEASVPQVTAPTEAAVQAELELIRQQRGLPPPGKGKSAQAGPSPEELAAQEQARAIALRKAQLERQHQVRERFQRQLEKVRREAFERATAKKMERKIREAILARRLEKALTKEEILYLYLNNVYLGHHSYGVQAAAENYFRKDVRDLTLAEISLIAGLPQAPSRYSPFRHPERAKKRRSYVLRRMLVEGMITQAEHDEADATDAKVYPVEDVFREFAPYFVEQVRKDVVSRYGNPTLLTGGLRIYTTMDSERQRAAQEAMFHGLLAVDKRQGFRGPLMNLPDAASQKELLERGKKVLGDAPLQPGRFYVALVKAIHEKGELAEVQVGDRQGVLPLLGMRWARKVNPEGYYPAWMMKSIKGSLKVGDVVVVRAVSTPKELVDDKEQWDAELAKRLPEGAQLFRLEQEPELQGALVSIDPHRQYLTAMVGGYDFDANEYNRAFQACRQPGSAFKPLAYGAALEFLDWTAANVIVDSPIVFDDPENQMRWKPGNFSDDFVGDVLLRTALVSSMNIPAVKTFQAVGIKRMSEFSRELGLSTPMNEDFSAALGSSCVYPNDLANVYATFNRYGVKRPTHFVRKIEDRHGRTLEDHTAFDDAWASLEDRVAAGYSRLFEPGERVMSPESGFILTDLLRAVVREGTGGPANALRKPAAGKTGTTNDSYDAWFAGYTRDLVTVTWVGYDLNQHPLARYETGGRASLPIWLAYMKGALDGVPQPEFSPPAGAELVKARVDKRTGRLVQGNSKGAVEVWFKKGTEPQDVQPDKDSYDPNNIMMMEY
jgi:penicillin-binding protein 1A